MPIDTNPGEKWNAYRPPVVVRAATADAWAAEAGLIATACRWGVAPTIGQATLVRDYGRITDTNGDFTDYPPADINRQWVRITVDGNTGTARPWYGILTETTNLRIGNDPIATGNQTFTARSPEWLLTRTPITFSQVRIPGNSAAAFVYNQLTFNESISRGQVQTFAKNRHPTAETGDANRYAFAEDTATGEYWTAANIADYLLDSTYNFVRCESAITWALTANARAVLETITPPNVPTRGQSVYQVLNRLIDRRHGYTWGLVISEPTATTLLIELEIYSFTDAPIALPGGGTLPANIDVITDWDFEASHDTTPTVIVDDASRRYEAVVVQGAKRGSVFSASYTNGLLKAGWSFASEATYIIGASANANYNTWDISRQRLANDSVRRSPDIADVFTRHVLDPDTWDGKSGDPTSASRLQYICPELDTDGNPLLAGHDTWFAGLRFERYLPTGATTSKKPFAAIKLPIAKDDPTDPDHWALADELSAAAKAEEIKGLGWACRVTMLVDAPGVSVAPTVPAHVMALDNWGINDATSDTPATVEYSDLLVTVYAQFDQRVSATWPKGAINAVNDQKSALLVDVGERARLDWIVAGTVVGIDDDGTLNKQSTGQWVNDDRQFLEDMARSIWLWHGTDRQALTVSMRSITTELTPGQFLQQIGPTGDLTDVNGVVTSLEIDFDKQQTTVRTQYAELDWTRLPAVA